MTLHQLTPDYYSRGHTLLNEQTHHHLFCAGVLSGKYPGIVVADQVEQPRAVVVIKDGMWCYPGGDPHHNAFHEHLRTAFAEKQFIGETSGGLLVSVPSDDWREVLNTLVKDRLPIEMPRRLYIADALHFDPNTALPDKFTLEFIDESLHEKVSGELPEDVQKVLSLRESTSTPDQMAFGYVALSEQKCAAHAMIDCIVDQRGEIGLVTEYEFRRKGLALALSAATIAYGLAHGLTVIHWDCATHNAGSVRVAEKLGLQLSREHCLYLIVFDQMGHLINLAWSHLEAGRFPAALESGEQVVALDNKRPYGHFLVAAAWAGLGDTARAFQHLNTAITCGWDDLAEIESCPPLRILQETPEWELLVSRIKANAQTAEPC